MLTKYDKAMGAGIGVALGTIIAYVWPMPIEVQGAIALVLSAGLTYFVPNRGF